MPIDFDAVIAPFRTAYFLQRRSISESLRKLAEWLTKRLKETQEREQATRAFHVFSFSGDALSVWIDTSQHGALGPEGEPPPSGFWATAAAPFVAFGRGLGLAKSMIAAETALPNLLATLARTVQMIIESLDRFKQPDKELFNVTLKRSWQDLIGEAGLFFRMINDPATVEQVKRFTSGGMELIGVIRQRFPSKPSTEPQAGGGLADLSRLIIGGILVLPAVEQLLTQMAQTANMVGRLKLLDQLTLIQNDVFGLRRDVIDFLYVTLFDIGRQALEWLVVLQADVIPTLGLYGTFAKVYFDEVQEWLKTTGKELKTFFDGLVKFLYGLGDYLESVMSVDLGAAVNPLPEAVFDLHFTLNDILEWRQDPSKAADLQKKIDDFRKDHWIIAWAIDERLTGLRDTIGIAATWTPFPGEAIPPDLSKVAFPNIYDAFFAGKEAGALRQNLVDTGDTLKTKLDAIFDAGILGLTDFSEAMGKAGTAAVNMGSAARYRRVAKSAAQLAETAFGDEIERARLARRQDPLAEAFESWLAGSGFQIIGKVLPRYVAEMIEFWKREASKSPDERPTSPHILARRAQIGRVRLPRMVIRVHEERELDKALAVEVADRARVGVARAFQQATAQYGGAR